MRFSLLKEKLFSGDKAQQGEKLREEQKNNVDLKQTESPFSAASFRAHVLPAVKAFQNKITVIKQSKIMAITTSSPDKQ